MHQSPRSLTIASIRFLPEGTLFTFRCKVETCLSPNDLSGFSFPINAYFYVIDDSKVQRRLLAQQLQQIGIPAINCIVLGKDAEEITSIQETLHQEISDYPDYYYVIICDENLDYTQDGIRSSVSGSEVCAWVTANIPEDSKCLTFVRSANDSQQEIELYEQRAHGFISKSAHRSQLKTLLASQWLKHFGVVGSKTEVEMDTTDIHELAQLFDEEFDQFWVAIEPLVGKHEGDWAKFWRELHKIKGSVLVIDCVEGGKEIAAQIDALRDNGFTGDFEQQWEVLSLRFL